MATTEELAAVRHVLDEMARLVTSEDAMLTRASERVSVILTDLMIELAPTEVQGPWQLRPKRSGAGLTPGVS